MVYFEVVKNRQQREVDLANKNVDIKITLKYTQAPNQINAWLI